MWNVFDLLFGSASGGGFSDLMIPLISPQSSGPVYRSPGGRAHRRWRKRRAAGRA
jgi:hypothetical protein